MSKFVARLVIFILVLVENPCSLARYLSWEILLFFLTYPWKFIAVNLAWEKRSHTVEQFGVGKGIFTAVSRFMSDLKAQLIIITIEIVAKEMFLNELYFVIIRTNVSE